MSASRPEQPLCDGCDRPLNPAEALHWSVCFPCTRARHQAVLKGRCACGSSRRPADAVSHLGRVWIPCRRCLGTIRQLG
jgi:hypothetical protein